MTASVALANGPTITQLSAELEMKDFHDTASTTAVEVGKSITLTFKNHVSVTVVLEDPQEKVVRMKTQLTRENGTVLYDSEFLTKYNADAELSEKNPAGDLVYKLKLNPHIVEK